MIENGGDGFEFKISMSGNFQILNIKHIGKFKQ